MTKISTQRYTSYIGVESVASPQADVFTTVFPGTGEVLGEVVSATPNDVDQAAEVAKKSQKIWVHRSPSERGRVLKKAAELLRRDNLHLAKLECLDTGKPIAETSAVDILSAADCLEYFGSVASMIHGYHVSLPGATALTRKEPYGVVAAMGAWNYPLQIAAWKAGPALAAGNSVLFKPSELTPITAIHLAKIFVEAGLPPGVFNVLQGPGCVGQWLVEHGVVRKVSLTGSVATGRKVAALAGQHLKKVSLELGGKSPIIIWDDADLDEAIGGVLVGNVFSQGEICSNGTRVFVHHKVYAKFVAGLLERLKKLTLGDPRESSTQIGALISRSHLEKVKQYIAKGKEEGAELLWGGAEPLWTGNQTPLAQGFYCEPTLFGGCHDGMTITREEIFGPVISLLEFTDEDEVIARANHLEVGLAAGIFTQNLGRAHRLAQKLEAGVVWINNYNITPVELPFGGVKHSGMGRENGLNAIDEYTQSKTVYIELDGVHAPY